MLYDYLMEKYGKNTPIFVSDISIDTLSDNTLRQQIKKLTDSGKLKRYDTGIYFIPGESIFKSGALISTMQVIESKYLREQETICGYISGLHFANQIGLTTQVPMVYEIVSNKATRKYREVRIGNANIILRKPRVKIADNNFRILQFLDCIKEIDCISELEGEELNTKLIGYMEMVNLCFEDLANYFSLYPDKLYKNLYETGLMYGISTQQ